MSTNSCIAQHGTAPINMLYSASTTLKKKFAYSNSQAPMQQWSRKPPVDYLRMQMLMTQGTKLTQP